MYTDQFDREWRFDVNPHDGTISRGRMYQLPESTESWQFYWDGSTIAGFYDEGFRGKRIMDTDATEDSERALAAYVTAANYGRDPHEALDAVAERISGDPDSCFISVGLNRGCDLYVHSWNGDPNNEWRDEIEAVYNGDVWRVEVEEYDEGWPGNWRPADEMCEEWYGEDKARAGWEKAFPLAEFPAERVIGESVGA